MCRSSPGFISASKVKSFLISQDKKRLRALNCHWYTYTLCTIAFFATVLFQNQTKPRKPVHIHLKYKTSIVFGKIWRCFQRLKQWHLIKKKQPSLGKALGTLVSCSTTEVQQISPPLVYLVVCF